MKDPREFWAMMICLCVIAVFLGWVVFELVKEVL